MRRRWRCRECCGRAQGTDFRGEGWIRIRKCHGATRREETVSSGGERAGIRKQERAAMSEDGSGKKTKPAKVPTLSRKPTMSDVARLAGVGTMTVSRVLSGTAVVSPETAQRVRTAIEQLRYRPNEIARAFRGQRSKTIGLILPYLYDPFFGNCAHAVTRVAKENGYTVIIATSNEDPETEYGEVDRMLQREVDGLVAIPARQHDSTLGRSLLGRTPLVVFDRPVADRTVDAVTVENLAGAQKMVDHLIGHGHRRIAFMGLSREVFTINERFLGYRQAMQEAGLVEDAFFGCDSEEGTVAALKQKMASGTAPTAVFTSNTLATRYVLSAILHLGIRIPDELAFAGFDDFDMAEFTAPPLTVVRQPAQQMGEAATKLLIERIAQGEIPGTGSRVVLPVELVLRSSCGCTNR